MSDRTTGRALTVAALTASLIGAGAGSPAGAAPVGPPYVASKATTGLVNEDGAFRASVTVLTVRGSGTVVQILLWAPGWACTVEEIAAEADLTRLESASVTGSYDYTCVPDEGGQGIASTPSGTATLDLRWTGVGETERGPNYDGAVGRYLVREAVVEGEMRLVDDSRGEVAMGVTGDAQLSYDHLVFPPGNIG